MNPDRWLGAPTGPLTFRATLERPGGGTETLLERTIDPRSDVSARRWLPVTIDLGRYAGATVTLELSVQASGAREEAVDLAGWAEPRFVASTGS